MDDRNHLSARVGLASKQKFLSKGLASQYEMCVRDRDSLMTLYSSGQLNSSQLGITNQTFN